MFVVSVTVWVNPQYTESFIEATLKNARATRNEPSNLRFDVSQAVDDPNRFLLYEVYLSEDGFKSHQLTRHYLQWKETVADWMAQPRQGVKHNSLFPASGSSWVSLSDEEEE